MLFISFVILWIAVTITAFLALAYCCFTDEDFLLKREADMPDSADVALMMVVSILVGVIVLPIALIVIASRYVLRRIKRLSKR